MEARQETENTPRDEKQQSSPAVVIGKKFRRRLQDQGHCEQAEADPDVDGPNRLDF